jgi:HPt (histidine-containing phosphotransfer) domain-containing protein
MPHPTERDAGWPVPSIGSPSAGSPSAGSPSAGSPSADGPVRSQLAGESAVQRVLSRYVAGLARDVEQMAEHLGGGRLADVRRLAHQLRGSGGTYGFPDVTRLATAVESSCDAGEPLARVAADVAALAGLIRRIEGYVPAGEPAARAA